MRLNKRIERCAERSTPPPPGRRGLPALLAVAIALTQAFTATAAPKPNIKSFSPASGSVGTPVTVSGNNFTGPTNVSFNGTSASFAFVSSKELTATVPAGASTGPISVTTGAGTATSAQSFTVTAPPPPAVVLAPAVGPPSSSLGVSGSGFAASEAVSRDQKRKAGSYSARIMMPAIPASPHQAAGRVKHRRHDRRRRLSDLRTGFATESRNYRSTINAPHQLKGHPL